MADNITAHMDKSLESLKHNFSKVRTGRANANIICPTSPSIITVFPRRSRRLPPSRPPRPTCCSSSRGIRHSSMLSSRPSALPIWVYPQLRWHRRSSSVPGSHEERRPARQGVPRVRRAGQGCLSVTSVATSTTSSSAMRSSPRTMSVASRPRSRSTPMIMSPRSRSF